MVSVKIGNVPTYLHNGRFYESLEKNNLEEEIEIPDGVLYPTVSFTNYQEMEHLFNSLRFWMVETLPRELVQFILLTESYCIRDALHQFSTAFPILIAVDQVLLARQENKEKNQQLLVAIQSGFLYLVDIMIHSGWKEYCGVSADAAGAGHLHILKYFHFSFPGKKLNEAVFIASIAGGYLECLKYTIEAGNCEYRMSHLVDRAAGHGQLECLRFLHTFKSQNALKEGQEFSWGPTTCARAASSGSLACLKYAHENGCQWDSSTCTWAAAEGQAECLRYALQHGCSGGSWTCLTAAENGHLECLVVARELGCVWDAEACAGAAAARGQVDCLRYALQQGCTLRTNICNVAAQEGHVECLRLAHESGCPIDATTYTSAESRAQVSCLEYLRGCSCPKAGIVA